MSSDTCIHIANVLYLSSYLCRDILWLRAFTCAGLVFGIVFFCSQTQAMFAPASWMMLFLAVNLYQMVRTILARRGNQLSPEQQEIAQLLCERLSRDDMLNVLAKSMCRSSRASSLLEKHEAVRLNQEERFVRETAFEKLSDHDLVNLLVRRFWSSIRRRKTGWFRPRYTPDQHASSGCSI